MDKTKKSIVIPLSIISLLEILLIGFLLGFLLKNQRIYIKMEKEYKSEFKKLVQLQDDIQKEQTSLINLQDRLSCRPY